MLHGTDGIYSSTINTVLSVLLLYKYIICATYLPVSRARDGVDVLLILERGTGEDRREAVDVAEELEGVGHGAEGELPSRSQNPAL